MLNYTETYKPGQLCKMFSTTVLVIIKGTMFILAENPKV